MDYGPQQDSANSEQMLWTIVHTEEKKKMLFRKTEKIDWEELTDHPIWNKPRSTEKELKALIQSLPTKLKYDLEKEIMDVLHLKLASCKEPSTMEQTMSREQLYLLGNPLWTDGLSAEVVETIRFVMKKDAEYGRKRKLTTLIEEVCASRNLTSKKR